MAKTKPPEDAIQKLRKAKIEEKKKEQVEEAKQVIGSDVDALKEVFYVVREIDIKTYELLKIRCNPDKLNRPALLEGKIVFENRVAGRGFTLDQQGLKYLYENNKRRNV